ncbi:MAG: aminopeptidase P family protein [Myxococcota bacterium]
MTSDAPPHRRRRDALARRVPGPVLLVGNGQRSRNLPMNKLPFRQDSSFLYFTGCALPDAAALLHDGRFELFLPEPADDDPLWHGSVPSLPALGERYGADRVHPRSRLEAIAAPLRPRTIAVADDAATAVASHLADRPLRYGVDNGDDALIDAIIALRRVKQAEELDEIREAARLTAIAFRAAIGATRPGSTERGLWTLFEAVLRIHGATTGYDTILTQSGEVLHHYGHDAELTAGRLVLLDGGGELASGYGVDVTRTWPVSGRYTARQRAAYDAVREAQHAAIARCTVGMRYREVHDTACRVLARFLIDEKLVSGTVDAVVEAGAHAVFFPHGVGHLLGLDVHDLENFGDRPAYPKGQGRPLPFGTRYLRLDLPLEAGWVVTIEPGFYVVPAILGDAALRSTFRGVVDFDRAAGWIGFGGIRIEDDVLITSSGPDVLTSAIPSRVDQLEGGVGTGSTAEALLWDP